MVLVSGYSSAYWKLCCVLILIFYVIGNLLIILKNVTLIVLISTGVSQGKRSINMIFYYFHYIVYNIDNIYCYIIIMSNSSYKTVHHRRNFFLCFQIKSKWYWTPSKKEKILKSVLTVRELTVQLGEQRIKHSWQEVTVRDVSERYGQRATGALFLSQHQNQIS